MKKLMIAAAVGVMTACVGTVYAGEEDAGVEEGVGKVVLKLAAVETPSTRSGKWNPPNQPMALKAKPFTESEIQEASPEEALRMVRENREVMRLNHYAQTHLALQQYHDAMSHYKGQKAKLEGTAFGRQILLAVDKFAGLAGECFDPDCIEFFHNMDAMGESEEAKLISGKENKEDLLTAPYFVKIIFDDPRTKVTQGMVAGTEVKRTTVTIGLTYEVQALSGKMVTSGNVKKEKSARETGAVSGSGEEQGLVVEAIEEALAEAAKRINAYFVSKVTVKVIPAKKDKEFDAESATMEIDGVSREIGDEISVMRGKHSITIDLDGYKQAGSIRFDIRKGQTIKIKMKKVEEKKAKDKDEE